MTALQYVLAILVIVVSVIIVLLVMLQESKQQGLGVVSGGGETFFGKNKSKTLDAKLSKLTKLCGWIFFILALASSLLVLFGV